MGGARGEGTGGCREGVWVRGRGEVCGGQLRAILQTLTHGQHDEGIPTRVSQRHGRDSQAGKEDGVGTAIRDQAPVPVGCTAGRGGDRRGRVGAGRGRQRRGQAEAEAGASKGRDKGRDRDRGRGRGRGRGGGRARKGRG